MLAGLRRLTDLPVVADVRGLGLWAAVEFASGPDSREPLAPEALRAIVLRARELGVFVWRNGAAIEMAPPMIITSDEMGEGVARFERAVREVSGKSQ